MPPKASGTCASSGPTIDMRLQSIYPEVIRLLVI